MEKLKAVEIIIRSVVIIIGGFWAYYRFFKDRIFTPRLDLQISNTYFVQGEQIYLVVKLDFINVGSAKINFLQKGTALVISEYNSSKEIKDVINVEKKTLTAFSILESHKWIELGRTIHEEKIIAIPHKKFLALELECRVVYKNSNQFQANISNTTSSVVTFENIVREDNCNANDS